MKILISSVFMLFLAVFCFAQKAEMATLDLQPDGNFYQRNHQQAFTGVAFENFPNGKKKYRAEFKKGKLHGKVTSWHNTGKKATLVHYQQGKRVGQEVHWFDTGARKLEINYDSQGKATGMCKEYFGNNKLKSEGKYENGMEEGTHKWYFKNGKLDQTVEYVKGKANGLIKHYFESGQLKMQGEYKEGKPHGKVVYFHDNGQKSKALHYTLGKENGLASSWSKKGLLQEERDYKNGKEIAYRNYRSGAIKTKTGYLQVFNGKESFYQIHVAADTWVRPRASRDITYVVGDFVLQLYDMPISSFAKQEMDEKTTLETFFSNEKKYIETATKSSIATQQKWEKYKGGTYLHWWFESPNLKNVKYPSNKTVEEEHYFSFALGNKILSLYVPKTKGNNISTILTTIHQIAQTIEVKNTAIDLNETRKSIRENAGLPSLPKNETFEGYKKIKQK